jgi:hypothetical protein
MNNPLLSRIRWPRPFAGLRGFTVAGATVLVALVGAAAEMASTFFMQFLQRVYPHQENG